MKHLSGNWVYAIVVCFIGASLSVAIGITLQKNAIEKQRIAFEHLLDRRTDELQQTVDEYKLNLLNTATFISAFGQEELTPSRFRDYVAGLNLKQNFPGALGLGFARKVPLKEEPAFLRDMQAKGLKDFQIRFISPSSQDRFVMQYIEPAKENHSAQGLDLGSENIRRENCLSAFSRAGLAVSKPITMIQNADVGRMGFTMLMPVFDKPVPSSDLGVRYKELLGWVSFPISIDRFLKPWVTQETGLEVRIFILEEANKPILFLTMLNQKTSTCFRTWRQHATYNWATAVGDWNTGLAIQPRRLDTTPFIWSGHCWAFPLSLFLAFKLKKALDTHDSLTLHEQMVNNSSEALIAEDSLGRILVWNRAAETLFGLDRASVLYDQERNLTVPEELQSSEKRLHQRAAQGEALKNIQTLRTNDAAQRIHLRMNLSPVYGRDHKLIGYTKSFRDETEARMLWKDMHAMEELIAHAPDGVITLDQSRRIKLANPAALLLLQGTNLKSTLTGQKMTDLLAPDVMTEFEQEVLNPLYRNRKVEVLFNWPVPGHMEQTPLLFRGFVLSYPDLGESVWALRFEKRNRSYTIDN